MCLEIPVNRAEIQSNDMCVYKSSSQFFLLYYSGIVIFLFKITASSTSKPFLSSLPLVSLYLLSLLNAYTEFCKFFDVKFWP